MVAGALDDCRGAGEADREPLAGDAVEKRLAGNRAVQHCVADDDVLGAGAAEVVRTAHDDAPARQALAGVVVGVTDEVERDPVREERAEALPGGAVQLDVNRVLRQAGVTVLACHYRGQHRANRAIDVADRRDEAHAFATFERRPALFDQLMVERLRKPMPTPYSPGGGRSTP